jgi:PAS domain S-box-containing protein
MKRLTIESILKSVNEDSSVNTLVESSPVCHKIFDPDFKLKFMSKSGVAALKIENIEDFYGHIFPTDAAPKNTRDVFNETMRLATKGQKNTIEYSFAVDGEVIWYRTAISPFFNEEGNLIYITADSMDITSTKQTEEIIQRNEQRLAAILSNSMDGIFSITASGTIVIANPAIEKLFGYSNSELIGQNILILLPESYRESHTQGLERYLKTGNGKVIGQLVEVEGLKKDGSVFPMELAISEYIVENKSTFIGNIRDITERKNTEKELMIAKESAEKSSHAKSEFLSRMSHELRTPMNAILGFTQLMTMDTASELTDLHKENLKRVSSSGNHLLELINDVLDIAGIESGNLAISINTFDIFPIVNNVILDSKSLADKNGISIDHQEIQEDACFANVDSLRFKQVVINMLSNAIKYNKPNGSIVISYEKQNNGRMRLGIQDTGHGIPDDKKNRLFKPFERFDVDAESIEGTGIGLTISKKLIELMNGTIGFESTLGKGSFFYIDFPICDKIPFSTQVEKNSDTTESSLTKSHKKKILCIDDIPSNMALVEQILFHRQHIKLLSASNALDGIEIASAETPDLILMDIQMPGIDGLTAFKKLQAINETADIPVIALTADAMDGDVEKAMAMGFKAYITKPIDVQIFLNTIDDIFT